MKVVDLRGTRCPLTLLKIKQYLYNDSLDNDKGGTISFLFDDQGAAKDLPVFLKRESLWVLSLLEHQLDQQHYYEARCQKNLSEKKSDF